MTNLFERIRTILAANINDMLDRAENPLVMLNQIIRDLHDQRRQLRTLLINAMADERQLQQHINEHIAEAGKWQQKAVYSIGQQRDDLARGALAQRLQEEGRIKELRSRQAAQQTEIARMQQLAERLDERIASLEQRRLKFMVTQSPASGTQTGQSRQTLDMVNQIGTNLEQADRYLDRLSEQNDREGHLVDLQVEALRSSQPDPVSSPGLAAGAELDALMNADQIEQELSQLKSRVQQQLEQDS